ncbi:putative water channel protein AQP-h2 [Paratrimastix pyriformis]|uniref:Water channel protein AQP-h2 n=1 Tax=Paratrimastix pyriformis TaxID=342808 RepID=A0ABQ8UY72_9EUKA|nr:putative water channel protein AQP-h2 [Paratrimastix pyriformis]
MAQQPVIRTTTTTAQARRDLPTGDVLDSTFTHPRVAPFPSRAESIETTALHPLPFVSPFATWKEELSSAPLYRAGIAELVGTAIFLIFGVGTAIFQSTLVGATLSMRAFVVAAGFGLGYIFAASLFGQHSLALFNPAFSFALFCIGRVSFVRFLCDTLSELIGGIIGVALLWAMIPATEWSNGAPTLPAATATWGTAFLCESVLASLLGMGLSSLLTDPKQHHRNIMNVVMGLGIAMATLVGFHISGGSFNPARSFASSVVGGVFGKSHWIYWLAPLIGAAVGAGVYYGIFNLGLKEKPAQEYQEVGGGYSIA